MSETTEPVPLELIETNEESGEQTVVGKLELAADGVLKLLAAKPDRRAPLAAAVKTINEKDGLRVEVPAAPGSPKFAVASRLVVKGSEDYLGALKDYFTSYHQLTLEQAH